VRADRFTVRLRLLPLLGGKVVIGCEARIGGGKVTAEVPLVGGGKMTADIKNLRLEDVPFFPSVTGAKVQGGLTAQATLRGQANAAAGELKLEVKAAEVSGVKIGGLPLPDATYRTVQGMLRASGGKVVLESFTLDGEGLYVRLKGDFPLTIPVSAAPLNLTLELMPKPDFLDRQKFVFLLLTKYVTSPGHYEIPVRGTLGKPAVF
ncbi:MAG TPA: type II secretion system protein GspN, partial [Geobacteraceae bacterium]